MGWHLLNRRDRYPEEYADRSWDNVGLLVENVSDEKDEDDSRPQTVLLTNDLTPDVVTEAIEKEASVIVAYRM